jgi:hypothetical protein
MKNRKAKNFNKVSRSRGSAKSEIIIIISKPSEIHDNQTKAPKIDEFDVKTIETRLQAIKESVQRIRSIMIMLTIVSAAIGFAIWNANISRERTLAFPKQTNSDAANANSDSSNLNLNGSVSSNSIANYSNNQNFSNNSSNSNTTPNNSNNLNSNQEPLHIRGRRTLVDEWYKSRSIQVNLLGIKADVGDLAVTGSIALIVITIWYFYSYLQSNRIIIEFLDFIYDKYKDNKFVCNFVYQSVIQTSIFTRNYQINKKLVKEAQGHAAIEKKPSMVQKFLETIKTIFRLLATRIIGFIKIVVLPITFLLHKITSWIDNKFLEDEDRAVIGLEEKAIINTKYEKATASDTSFGDRIVKFLFYLPFWAVTAIIIRDVHNLFVQSPVSETNIKIGMDIINQARKGEFESLFLLIVFDGFAILSAFYLRVLCNNIYSFAYANTKTLNEFYSKTIESVSLTLANDTSNSPTVVQEEVYSGIPKT